MATLRIAHITGAHRHPPYSYVNPAIADFLGWQFLHEPLSVTQLLGMVIVGVGILALPGGSVTDPKIQAEPKTQ